MSQYRAQQAIAGLTASSALKLWRTLGADFSQEWQFLRSRVLEVVERGRDASVREAIPYTAAVLAETGQVAPAAGDLIPARFTMTAPDGRDMASLLDQSIAVTKRAVAGGEGVAGALSLGGRWLTGTTLTVVADTRRQVYHADIVARPGVGGYCRMLNAPSCSRCVVLAGKWFAWNKGFDRHPRCDCTHIPTSESLADDFRTDPGEYFASLSERQQDKVFGRSNARAIRDGADLNRVVNVQQRGLSTARGTRRGQRARLTVDDIYRQAGTRANAIRLLAQEGYMTYSPGSTLPLT